MSRTSWTNTLVLIVVFCAMYMLQSWRSVTAKEESSCTLNKQSITMTAALRIAQEALAFGKAKGANMAIVVVDNSGLPLVTLRDDDATEQFAEGARQKAWTAVNLKDSTRTLLKQSQSNVEDDSMLPFVPNALLLMGGVPLKVGDTIVGAIGAAGSPSGFIDDETARHGAAGFSKLLKK